MFWLGLVMLLAEVAALVWLHNYTVPDRPVPGGTKLGIGTEAFVPATKMALITAIPLSLVFVWTDRFRPQRFWIWLITFGWGAGIATSVAMKANTWAAGAMMVRGDGDPMSAARAATFIAPFVEEAAKATVLFWLAILMRYRWVSRLSGIALAGIAATGFAFVENILYYGRTYRAAAVTTGAASPEEALHDIFLMRGVFTFFGHPLFTCMTGIGLALAMRSRSKLVRILAPNGGFLVAAALHMMFNGTASTATSPDQLLVPYVFLAIPLVLGLVAMAITQLFKQKRLIGARLGDYVAMGWLEPEDPHFMSRLSSRLHALYQALWGGRFLATISMQRAMTELAYLRDAMGRGLVDDAGLIREKQLFFAIRRLRTRALVQPLPKTIYPRLPWTRHRAPAYAPAAYPGPAGLGGNLPAPSVGRIEGTPLGSSATQYSEVNPAWRPPSHEELR